MSKSFLKQMIEDADDKQLTVFTAELEKLSDNQLRQLLPLVGISFKDNDLVSRDDMIYVMDETTWGEFFAAYNKVVGKRFILDTAD